MVAATDIQARIGRPLTPGETDRVTAYIDDATAEAERLVPGVSTDTAKAGLFTKAVCAAVIRAARLPDALGALAPQDESTGFPTTQVSSGNLYFRRDELRDLGYRTIRAVRTTPGRVRGFFPTDRCDGELWRG